MAACKTSSLPAVLKDYLPDYEQAPGQKHKEHPSKSCKGGAHGNHGNKSASPSSRRKRSALSRERSSDLLKQQEAEKHGRLYASWQRVKREAREEDTTKLKRKVVLQQEVIRKHDEHRELLERQRLEDQDQKRQEEKQTKQAKADELKRICQQSLEEDRARHAAARGRPTASSSSPDRRTSAHDEPDEQLVSEQHDRDPGPLGLPTYVTETTRSSMGAPYVAGLTPQSSTLGEEDELEDHEGVMDEGSAARSRETTNLRTLHEDEEEELPWHHAQLYEMYGAQADYFLHPKIEPEKKRAVRPINSRLRREAGSMGAGDLWQSLRNESYMKLIDEDCSIPTELKHAYSAFVRQCLSNRKRPVKRNYYQEEDVPDMQRLLDQSKLQSAADYRHKMALMFRACAMNEDKAHVLMFNNPPPDLNNWTGDESVQRYVRDKEEDGDQSSISELSYKKWLEEQSPRETAQLSSPRSLPPLTETPAYPRQPDWHIHRRQKSVVAKQQPIVFLTEKDATVQGEFSSRRKAALEAKTMPKAFTPREQDGEQDGPDTPSSRGSRASGRTGGAVSRPGSQQWQPLSLSALAEYRDQRDVRGHGNFSHGRQPVWPVQ